MSEKPETRLQKRIREALEQTFPGSFWRKIHGGPYQRKGLPDLLGCVSGFYVAIEVKIGTSKATPLQQAVIKGIKDAGGIAFISTGVDYSIRVLTKHLNGKFARTRLYNSWHSMMGRCYNGSHISYPYYGAKGITVCSEWQKGVFFLWRDLGFPPDTEEERFLLDRIDRRKGYSPVNCRWVTVAESNCNKGDTRNLTYNGMTKPLAQWADTYNMSKQLLRYRLDKMGLPLSIALTRPVKSNGLKRRTL